MTWMTKNLHISVHSNQIPLVDCKAALMWWKAAGHGHEVIGVLQRSPRLENYFLIVFFLNTTQIGYEGSHAPPKKKFGVFSA